VWETLAEALSGDIEKDSLTLAIADRVIDHMLCVSETQIASAMRFMLETQGWLAEGGGCVGVASVLHGLIPADDKPTALIVSGGNVDIKNLKKILDV
jgi:threonine dehydratase